MNEIEVAMDWNNTIFLCNEGVSSMEVPLKFKKMGIIYLRDLPLTMYIVLTQHWFLWSGKYF